MDDKRTTGDGGKPPPYAFDSADAQNGDRAAKTGYPPPQQGYPPPQQGYPPPQQGYPPPQQGYPQPQTGYPHPQQGPPQSQTGYPQPHERYLQPQPQYPQPQPGHPQPQPGYPVSVLGEPPTVFSNRHRHGYYDPVAEYNAVWGSKTTTVTSGGATFLLGANPVSVTCPSCNHQVVTDVHSAPDMRTHLFAFIMCFFCFPFLWVPYCVDSCQSKKHFCPECGCFIGTYRD